MKAVFLGLLLSSLGLLAALHAAELPSPDGLPFPDGIEHVRVERSDSDKYKFLHDPAIEVHKGELFAAWYNCPQQEIVGESLIRCRRSKDGGKTWGAVEVIASDTSGDGTYYVPAQLLSHGGALHAFVGTMKGGHDLIKSCAVYVLDEATNRWQPRGEIADLFLPNCQPIKMADGNWIMAGRAASRFGVKPFIPAVAISQGDDLTGRWNVVPLQAEMTPAQCPETTVWVEGSKLLALTRNNTGAVPFVYASQDYGRTWNAVEEHTLDGLGRETVCRPSFHGRALCGFQPARGRREGLPQPRNAGDPASAAPANSPPRKCGGCRTARLGPPDPSGTVPSTIPAPSNTRVASSCSTPSAVHHLVNVNSRSFRSRRSNSKTAEEIRNPNA